MPQLDKLSFFFQINTLIHVYIICYVLVIFFFFYQVLESITLKKNVSLLKNKLKFYSKIF